MNRAVGLSTVSIVTRLQPAVHSVQGKDFLYFPQHLEDSGTHKASYSMVISGGRAFAHLSYYLTLHLTPRLRMHGAILRCPHMSSSRGP